MPNGQRCESPYHRKIVSSMINDGLSFCVRILMPLMVLYMSFFTEGCGLSDIILETRAKVDIEKGEEITIHYAGGLKPRMTRKKLLKDGWFFDCQCIRWVPIYRLQFPTFCPRSNKSDDICTFDCNVLQSQGGDNESCTA